MKRLIGVFALTLLLGFGGLYLATREAIFSPATYAAAEFTAVTATVAVLSLVLIWLAPVVGGLLYLVLGCFMDSLRYGRRGYVSPALPGGRRTTMAMVMR